MPLTAYLAEGVFDKPAIDAMTAAFNACCWYLALADQDDPQREIVARKVIEIAGTGERDAASICGLVLLALSNEQKRTA